MLKKLHYGIVPNGHQTAKWQKRRFTSKTSVAIQNMQIWIHKSIPAYSHSHTPSASLFHHPCIHHHPAPPEIAKHGKDGVGHMYASLEGKTFAGKEIHVNDIHHKPQPPLL